MRCTRCGTLNPIGSTRCGRCGLVFPAPIPVAPTAVPVAVTTAPAVTPATGTIPATPRQSNWTRFSEFVKRKFQRTPTPTAATTTPAATTTTTGTITAPVVSRFQRAKAKVNEWFETGIDWLLNSIRIVFAFICTLIWLYGVLHQNAVLSTFPAAGMLYYVPLEIQFAKRLRLGVTLFWVLMWAGVFLALRSRGV